VCGERVRDPDAHQEHDEERGVHIVWPYLAWESRHGYGAGGAPYLGEGRGSSATTVSGVEASGLVCSSTCSVGGIP
jgi:hypothetical protein